MVASIGELLRAAHRMIEAGSAEERTPGHVSNGHSSMGEAYDCVLPDVVPKEAADPFYDLQSQICVKAPIMLKISCW